MNPLLPPLPHADHHRLRAAEGWLGLGDRASAVEELDAVSPEFQTHPDVLKLRWWVHLLERQWEPAAQVAQQLTEVAPDEPEGWIHCSFALHELKRTAEAREKLLAVVARFPQDGTMRYNLACYECRLGDLAAARRWLELAFAADNGPVLKASAVEDPDLEPLWAEIRGA
jgi:Flp pilus assembly protein TadD